MCLASLIRRLTRGQKQSRGRWTRAGRIHLESRAQSLKQASRPMRGLTVSDVELESILTCPECGHRATETMPVTACQFFYECTGCGVVLRPNQGACCVFCSFGTVPCPPKRSEEHKYELKSTMQH